MSESYTIQAGSVAIACFVRFYYYSDNLHYGKSSKEPARSEVYQFATEMGVTPSPLSHLRNRSIYSLHSTKVAEFVSAVVDGVKKRPRQPE